MAMAVGRCHGVIEVIEVIGVIGTLKVILKYFHPFYMVISPFCHFESHMDMFLNSRPQPHGKVPGDVQGEAWHRHRVGVFILLLERDLENFVDLNILNIKILVCGWTQLHFQVFVACHNE